MYRFSPYDPYLKNQVCDQEKKYSNDLNKGGNGRILELQGKKRRFLDPEKHLLICVTDVDEELNSTIKAFHLTFKQWILGPESLWDCCNLPGN